MLANKLRPSAINRRIEKIFQPRPDFVFCLATGGAMSGGGGNGGLIGGGGGGFVNGGTLSSISFENYRDKIPRASGESTDKQHASTIKPPLFIFAKMSSDKKLLKIAGREFRSRLFLGTGKFSAPEMMRDALEASGAEMVTVALRRADLTGKRDPFANILEFIDAQKYLLLPNTSGAMNANEAVRLARLAVAAGLPNWIKLEIHPDPRYLLPDPVETFRAAEILVKEGFVVLPYINADPVLAKRLQDVGVATVMPLGSPIGSNRGIETRAQIQIIIEQATVPVVVDAGIGAPSHAAEAMEMGADAVLVNTAIAVASDPLRMANAFKMAVECGREAYEIGLAAELETASATSPLTAFLN
jgi:thiazole synthase